ncbi:MAG TPA: putative Ig domain-containing protein, partial [Verrucomicrobiae bacterium]|nr:putative Ig domain-containing protein [Verrucomicrobiae bacterium]
EDSGTPVNAYGHSFTLNRAKTIKNIRLPSNGNLVVLAISLANTPVSADLTSYYNRAGIYTDGTTFTNPPTRGIDGSGWAYSATLLGSSQTWSNILFNFGPANATNVISATGQTLALPAGNYSYLRMLATGVQGSQPAQSFVVNYSDGATGIFSQSLSDWFVPQNYSGESKAIAMGQRNGSDGAEDRRTFYLYGYSFKLNSAKTLESIRLPDNANVIVLAISLVPNWRPVFAANPFVEPGIIAGQIYSGTIATNAYDLNDDFVTFAKLNGPSWLTIAENGLLSGTPHSGDVGVNTFVVRANDSGNLFDQATFSIAVAAAPPIISEISVQDSNLTLNWSGGIAPYQVQMTTNLISPDWENLGGAVSGNSLVILPTNAATFYRILGQ